MKAIENGEKAYEFITAFLKLFSADIAMYLLKFICNGSNNQLEKKYKASQD